MTIVYHGSKAQFNSFDYSKIGENGTSEGKGFYFTDNKRIAEGYGQNGFLYVVDFKGKNPLNDKDLTITEDQFKQYLIALHEEMDYLSNWGEVEYSGLESVLNEAIEGEFRYCDNDVDLISGIANASGNTGRSLELCYEVLGYDCIIITAEWGNQELYIALTNDVIEIVDIEEC